MHYAKVYKMPNTSLRFFNVYGPRSRTTGAYGAVFGVFLAQKLSNKPLTIVGDGNQTRDFIHVYDLVEAISKVGIKKNLQPVKPVTYSVIKAGLVGLTRYLATYWPEDGVRCNALSPGGIYNGQGNDFVSKVKSLIPMGRMAKKDEYRSTVQYLCSDASSYMNGQNIVVDGGRSVW